MQRDEIKGLMPQIGRAVKSGFQLKQSGLKSILLNIILYYAKLLLLPSHFSRVWLSVTPQRAAHQAPPSLGLSRQEHWSGLPFPSPVHESEKWKRNYAKQHTANKTNIENSIMNTIVNITKYIITLKHILKNSPASFFFFFLFPIQRFVPET